MPAFDSNAGGFGDEEDQQKKTQAYPPSTVATATPAASTQATAPYADASASTPSTPASQPNGFGDQTKASAAPAAAPAPTWGDGQGGQYSWNTGDYGAEGAWTNGYNPHWDHASAPQTAPSQSAIYSDPTAPGGALSNPRLELPAAGEGWTPFKQGQLKQGDAGYDPTWDANLQRGAPQAADHMGGYTANQPVDWNGINGQADPDNTAWGNGQSYNQYQDWVNGLNGQSQQYNAGEDARYAREMAAWDAAHGGASGVYGGH